VICGWKRVVAGNTRGRMELLVLGHRCGVGSRRLAAGASGAAPDVHGGPAAPTGRHAGSAWDFHLPVEGLATRRSSRCGSGARARATFREGVCSGAACWRPEAAPGHDGHEGVDDGAVVVRMNTGRRAVRSSRRRLECVGGHASWKSRLSRSKSRCRQYEGKDRTLPEALTCCLARCGPGPPVRTVRVRTSG
jgi:hypothetical protein